MISPVVVGLGGSVILLAVAEGGVLTPLAGTGMAGAVAAWALWRMREQERDFTAALKSHGDAVLEQAKATSELAGWLKGRFGGE